MTTDEFANKYGGYWQGQHPDYPVEDWQYQVQNGDTRMGYWEWAQQMDSE